MQKLTPYIIKFIKKKSAGACPQTLLGRHCADDARQPPPPRQPPPSQLTTPPPPPTLGTGLHTVWHSSADYPNFQESLPPPLPCNHIVIFLYKSKPNLNRMVMQNCSWHNHAWEINRSSPKPNLINTILCGCTSANSVSVGDGEKVIFCLITNGNRYMPISLRAQLRLHANTAPPIGTPSRLAVSKGGGSSCATPPLTTKDPTKAWVIINNIF